MGYQETITFILEMIGTIAFAASGALVGSEQKMDIFGVSVLGVITAVGGGMIRDVTLGITPPGVFQKPVYAAVAVLTSVLVFFLLYFNSLHFLLRFCISVISSPAAVFAFSA